jgi:uncharacterized protein (TIGR03790 family)
MVAFALTALARAEQSLAPATVVVFNSSVPESQDLAKFYAQKRGIPRENLVGLACPRDEEISRQDFDRTIAEPLRETFRARKWWSVRQGAENELSVTSSSIQFVALIKGMPLKVRAVTEPYPGDQPQGGPVNSRNEASVDSELAVLGRWSPQISGATTNPYYQSFRAAVEGIDPAMLLVCRLDAPSAATVRRMITDAVEVEKTGLWGRAYVDGAHNTSGGLEIGDRWLGEVVTQLRKSGIPTVYDESPAIFPDGFPINDAALYYGWYAPGVAGPFTQPSFAFTAGAVAVHIHSFSANTLRDPNANWVAPLLTKGAAASLGNVYEPYLQLTTHLSIFNDRLLNGFTFAESAYMATQALSWMTVMVGDPLYRPFGFALQFETKGDPAKPPSEWRMYREFALQNTSKPPSEFRTLARQAASRARNASMIEDVGAMEARDRNFASATSCYQQARSLYTKRDDIIRVVLEEADAWVKQEKPKRAVELVRSVLKIVSDAPTVALLRKIEQDSSPPAPGALPTPAKP